MRSDGDEKRSDEKRSDGDEKQSDGNQSEATSTEVTAIEATAKQKRSKQMRSKRWRLKQATNDKAHAKTNKRQSHDEGPQSSAMNKQMMISSRRVSLPLSLSFSLTLVVS